MLLSNLNPALNLDSQLSFEYFNKMEIKPILENIRCSAAAPTPKVLANEKYVYLMFFVEDSSVQDAENSPFNRVPVDQIISIRFDKYSKYQLSEFDVDNISEHEYFTLGLEPYHFQEILNSDWIDSTELRTDPVNLKRHIILPMKDSCFEIVCENYTIMDNNCQTMREEVLRLAEWV